MTEMRQIINHLTAHKTLTSDESEKILSDIAQGKYNEVEMASFLTVYLMRNVTVDELIGFRDALLNHCIKIDLQQDETIDLCGTGGDGKDTFNISTIASFVAAGAGAKVAKHGNYGVSSSCGSSNILEYFGYKFTNNEDNLRKQIDQAGICFLHAPLFNPAMKNVAPVRKSLRVKTFFNMLGPMVNPAFPTKQFVGVFSLELARLYGYIYQKKTKKFTIIHSLDGYDEISLTSDFKIITNNSELIQTPEDIGYNTIKAENIKGGKTIKESAGIFINILENKATASQQNVVAVNTAFALKNYYNKDFEECKVMADESIKSGKALNAFKKMIGISN
jgi:anthranilate phosphoribosyltransferase